MLFIPDLRLATGEMREVLPETVLAFADSLTVISRIEGAFAAAAADTDLTGRVLVVAPRNAPAKVKLKA